MLLIGVSFFIQLFSVGSVANVQTGGVAYMAHIGGMLFGALTASLFLIPSASLNSELPLRAKAELGEAEAFRVPHTPVLRVGLLGSLWPIPIPRQTNHLFIP